MSVNLDFGKLWKRRFVNSSHAMWQESTRIAYDLFDVVLNMWQEVSSAPFTSQVENDWFIPLRLFEHGCSPSVDDFSKGIC
jgi:hypothetical protein